MSKLGPQTSYAITKKPDNLSPDKHMFDPDMAVLPIMLATWDDSFTEARITYQNPKSIDKFGNLKGRCFKSIFMEVCTEKGKNKFEQFLRNKRISLSGSFKGIDIKFHSRMHGNTIQTSISDNTKIFEYRDKIQRAKIIDSFLMIGSHELKTPLNAIMGLSSLLLQSEQNKETLELLELIYSSSEKLDGLINSMLKFIYLDSSPETFNKSEIVNISEILANSFKLLDKYLYDRDFSMERMSLQSKKELNLPKGLIEDILQEIVINLRRNTPVGAKVEIRNYDLENSVKLEIENQGEGIPPEKLNDVFKPFYLTQDKMHHSSGFEYGKAGMGMGLTIIKRSLDQLGGKIWFENKYEYEKGKDNCVILNIEFPVD
jgi:signal transduction histidine kinase